MLNGVPTVGDPGKTCDNGNLDPGSRNSGCANSFVAYLAVLVFLSSAVLEAFLKKKHDAEEAAAAAKMGGNSGDRGNSFDSG